MRDERIKILYQLLIDGLELTEKNLVAYGLTKEDITVLIEIRKTIYLSEDKYILTNVEHFMRYGVELLKARKVKEAKRCFEVAYKLNPKNKNISYHYLLSKLKEKDYATSFEIITNLETVMFEGDKRRTSLMLYLLSFITTCPAEYQERVLDIKLKDLKGERTPYNKEENIIIENIMKGKFKHAHKLLENLVNKLDGPILRFALLKELLNQVIEKDIAFNKTLLSLAKNKQYEELFAILFNTQYERQLTIKENNIILIVGALIKKIRGEEIYTSDIDTTYDISKALLYGGYKKALEIHFRYVNMANDIDNDVVTILLLDLCSLLEQNNKKEVSKESNDMEEAREYVNHIIKSNMSIGDTVNQWGLNHKFALLVKIAYAEYCYNNALYQEGDKLLQEVSLSKYFDSKVETMLKELRSNIENKNTAVKQPKTKRRGRNSIGRIIYHCG